MGSSARIESIDALKDLRTFICNFAKKISTAIDDANSDILSTFNWLKNDRHPYWKNQLRIRSEQLTKAKLELKRKQFIEKSASSGGACMDEKKALAIAQRRFDEAQDKLNKTRAWIPLLEKEGFACRGALQGLSNFIQIILPNQRAQIDRMIFALESYVNLSTPADAAAIADEMLAYPDKADYAKSITFDMEQFCKDVRRRNPLKDFTSDLPAAIPLLNQFKNFSIGEEILEVLKNNSENITSFNENDKLVFDRSVENLDFIYLEKFKAAVDAGIKWYIGPVKPDQSAGYSICKISDFLKSYLAMKAILSLPDGWLAVLKNNRLEAVCDAENKLVAHASPNEST